MSNAPQFQPEADGLRHTPTPWYVGAQNDNLYIITRPPRPSRDDIADIPDVKVVASMNTCRDGENAAFIVEAVNSHTALVAVAKMAKAAAEMELGIAAAPDFSPREMLAAADRALLIPLERSGGAT